MLRRRAQITEVSELSGFVYPARIADTDNIHSNRQLVAASLITMRSGLMQFASVRSDLIPDPVTEKLEDMSSCMRGRRFCETTISLATNGFVLQRLTHNSQVDLSHRLKVPTDGTDPEYHAESFNVDFQTIPSKPKTLTGIEEIAGDPRAVMEILVFERDILLGSMTNWQDFTNTNIRQKAC